jgi:hypothetical protein
VALCLAGLGGCASPQALDFERLVLRTFVTTELDERNHPTNNLTRVDMSGADGVYGYVTILHLPAGRYAYRCEFFDGARQLVHTWTSLLETDGTSWNVWCHYQFKRSVDVPGLWMVRSHLEGRLLAQTQFEVVGPLL